MLFPHSNWPPPPYIISISLQSVLHNCSARADLLMLSQQSKRAASSSPITVLGSSLEEDAPPELSTTAADQWCRLGASTSGSAQETCDVCSCGRVRGSMRNHNECSEGWKKKPPPVGSQICSQNLNPSRVGGQGPRGLLEFSDHGVNFFFPPVRKTKKLLDLAGQQ
jgi:hypothetical protein